MRSLSASSTSHEVAPLSTDISVSSDGTPSPERSCHVVAVAQQRKIYVGMVLILIFAEALGLYGLIVGLILAAKDSTEC